MARPGKTRMALTPFLSRTLREPVAAVLFGGYFIVLTLLLLCPNPYRLAAVASGAVGVLTLLEPVAHFVGFAMLTTFTLLAFRSAPQAAVCLGLSGYASLTELLQRLIPPRTAEWGDWFQDIGGIAMVILVGWLIGAFYRTLRHVGEEESAEASALN
jgi:hypothetical protein